MFSGKLKDIENDLKLHSQIVTEERQQQVNDRREAQGLTPRHCGTEVSTNSYGDYECVRCSDTF